MELLYVWIEDYNNIHHQGFNFSPKHRFEFTPTAYDENKKVTSGTLTHKPTNTNYPKNFFGEHISNITAIVGRNGSGKSSLVKALYHYTLMNKGYLFIYEKIQEEKQTEIMYCSNITVDIKFDTPTLIRDTTPALFSEKNNLFIGNVIYYSPFINSNRNKLLSSKIDNNIGNMEQMATTLFSIAHNPNSEATAAAPKQIYHPFLSAYCAQEMTTQISFIKEITSRKEQIIPPEIVIPKEVELGIPFYGGNLSERMAECPNSDDFILYMIVDALNRDMFNKGKVREEDFSYSITEIEANEWLEDICEKRGYKKEEIESFCRLLNHEVPVLDNYGDDEGGKVVNYTIPASNLPQEVLLKRETGARSSWVNDLAVTLTWHDLSDGEATMLSLFARLWEKLQKTNHSCIVLLDEFELGLHPQWQKEAIGRLVKFFEMMNKKHHIILVSHSPFLVSDLPRENIIFLDKDAEGNCVVKAPQDMERTFGANIHSLYRSSFFMDGVMGKFAEEKIDGVIKDLNGRFDAIEEERKETRKKEMEYIIGQIGEPIIRNELRKMYNEKFHLFGSLDERIAKLEGELAELKSMKG